MVNVSCKVGSGGFVSRDRHWPNPLKLTQVRGSEGVSVLKIRSSAPERQCSAHLCVKNPVGGETILSIRSFCFTRRSLILWYCGKTIHPSAITKGNHTTYGFRFILLLDLPKFVHTESSKHYFCSSFNSIICQD